MLNLFMQQGGVHFFLPSNTGTNPSYNKVTTRQEDLACQAAPKTPNKAEQR